MVSSAIFYFVGSIDVLDEDQIRVGSMPKLMKVDWVCRVRVCIVMAGLMALAGCAEQGFTARWQRPRWSRDVGVTGTVVLTVGQFTGGAGNRYGLYVGEYLGEQLRARQADRATQGATVSGGGGELPVEGRVSVTDVSGGVSGERVMVEVVFDLLTEVSDGRGGHSVRLTEFVERSDEARVGGSVGEGRGRAGQLDDGIRAACRVAVEKFLGRVYPDDAEMAAPLAGGWTRYDYRGRVLAEQGDYAGALVMFGKAIDARPDDHAALYNAGVVCEALGDYEHAVRYYGRALRLAEEADYQRGLERVKPIVLNEQAMTIEG